MDSKKVDQILKFALAAAGRRDTPRERELGPIHLIKLVYLADLAHAQRHHGQTFTGAPWRFHHYGPWTEQVWKRLDPVVHELNANVRTFSSSYKDDHQRWGLQDPEQVEEVYSELDRSLPFEVTSAVSRGIRQFGTDTTSLLHMVYRTQPMLRTRPGELLRFDLAVAPDNPTEPPDEPSPVLTPKQQKKQKEALRELREKVQRRLKERQPTLVEPPTPPTYDTEFIEGVRWLDSLAGEPLRQEEGQLHFTNEVWEAPDRGELDEDT
jgi:hypothetical protein